MNQYPLRPLKRGDRRHTDRPRVSMLEFASDPVEPRGGWPRCLTEFDLNTMGSARGTRRGYQSVLTFSEGAYVCTFRAIWVFWSNVSSRSKRAFARVLNSIHESLSTSVRAKLFAARTASMKRLTDVKAAPR